jgi:hypothetical protein
MYGSQDGELGGRGWWRLGLGRALGKSVCLDEVKSGAQGGTRVGWAELSSLGMWRGAMKAGAVATGASELKHF